MEKRTLPTPLNAEFAHPVEATIGADFSHPQGEVFIEKMCKFKGKTVVLGNVKIFGTTTILGSLATAEDLEIGEQSLFTQTEINGELMTLDSRWLCYGNGYIFKEGLSVHEEIDVKGDLVVDGNAFFKGEVKFWGKVELFGGLHHEGPARKLTKSTFKVPRPYAEGDNPPAASSSDTDFPTA